MSFKWPAGGAKVQAIGRLNVGIPEVILSQLLEVSDQIDTIGITVVDAEGESHTFTSKMRNDRRTWHMVTFWEDMLADLKDQDLDIEEDDDGAA